jgi:hypothetical protein
VRVLEPLSYRWSGENKQQDGRNQWFHSQNVGL